MKFLSIVVCFLWVNSLMASETYKAGVLHLQNKDISEFTPFIHSAGATGLDILVLPPLEPTENYDEVISIVSKAARQAGLYVVIHLYEKARCQLGYEMVRSNLVFDRKGAIVAVYRKAQNGAANCTTSDSDLVTFATDFGVTFGVLMEEDIVLYDEEHLKGVKNFVMTGDWQAEVPFLNADQFAPSWTYITDANLVSTAGIYSGKAGVKTGADKLAVSELHKNGASDVPVVPSVNPSLATFAGDLSQYVIRPLDLEASSRGYKETVCHRSFCCEFYVKTGDAETHPESSYSLAAFNGIRPFSANHNIGTQICVISGSEKSNTFFELISITANFTKQNSQYPIVQSATVLPTEHFKFETNVNGIPQQVTLQIVETQNVINLGIFGKDATDKLEHNYVYGEKNSTNSEQNEIYDYIFNEDVQEFFDYVWIRLRILIVIVSIYILEMM